MSIVRRPRLEAWVIVRLRLGGGYAIAGAVRAGGLGASCVRGVRRLGTLRAPLSTAVSVVGR
jgi:hypothetical protein